MDDLVGLIVLRRCGIDATLLEEVLSKSPETDDEIRWVGK